MNSPVDPPEQGLRIFYRSLHSLEISRIGRYISHRTTQRSYEISLFSERVTPGASPDPDEPGPHGFSQVSAQRKSDASRAAEDQIDALLLKRRVLSGRKQDRLQAAQIPAAVAKCHLVNRAPSDLMADKRAQPCFEQFRIRGFGYRFRTEIDTPHPKSGVLVGQGSGKPDQTADKRFFRGHTRKILEVTGDHIQLYGPFPPPNTQTAQGLYQPEKSKQTMLGQFQAPEIIPTKSICRYPPQIIDDINGTDPF